MKTKFWQSRKNLISPDERERIRELFKTMPISEIAKATGRDKDVISRIVKPKPAKVRRSDVFDYQNYFRSVITI